MSPGRGRALLAVVIAIAAALGIALPGGGDDNSTSIGDQPPAPSAGTAQAPSAGAASASASTSASGGPSAGTRAGPSPTSEQGQAIARVLAAINSGAPSPYSEDGGTFENREGHLPSQPLGYYREYTVETPGSPDRGARRLVIGQQGDTWYTSDHYSSFERIDPGAYG